MPARMTAAQVHMHAAAGARLGKDLDCDPDEAVAIAMRFHDELNEQPRQMGFDDDGDFGDCVPADRGGER